MNDPWPNRNPGPEYPRPIIIRNILDCKSIPRVSKTIVQIYFTRITPTNRMDGHFLHTKAALEKLTSHQSLDDLGGHTLGTYDPTRPSPTSPDHTHTVKTRPDARRSSGQISNLSDAPDDRGRSGRVASHSVCPVYSYARERDTSRPGLNPQFSSNSSRNKTTLAFKICGIGAS